MKPKLILCLALVLSNSLFAGEPDTNTPPQMDIHRWGYIQYPWNLPNCPIFDIGWASGGNERSDEMSRGLRMDIMNISQGFAFFKTNAITVRLYRANGEIVEPTALGKRMLNDPVAAGSFSQDMPPSPQVITYFPWGPNVLQESWIKVTMGPERYWVEIPYGFDCNPADPLPPPNTNGPPRFVSAMKSLTEHDHVVRWQNVHYNLGLTQDGRELSLIQSNPVDAVSDVDLYNFPKTQNVYSPHTDVHLLDADGTVIHGGCVNIHLDDNHLRRTDTFDIFDRGVDDTRCWGQIEISVDDKTYRVAVPSSLYKYIHGHALKPVATDFLSKLSIGMTLEEANMASRNYIYNGIRNHPASDHQFRYIFTPDTNEVTLQFDESDRLVSWNDKP